MRRAVASARKTGVLNRAGIVDGRKTATVRGRSREGGDRELRTSDAIQAKRLRVFRCWHLEFEHHCALSVKKGKSAAGKSSLPETRLVFPRPD